MREGTHLGPLGFLRGAGATTAVYSLRLLLVTAWLVPACATRPASANDPRPNCREEMNGLENLSQGRKAIFTVHENPKGLREIDGELREELELRWQAFGRTFVVDASRTHNPKHPEEESGPRGYAGQMRGENADLVVFFKWPSGAWEGEVKIGQQLFVIRAQCGDRAAGALKPRSFIYHLTYPEKQDL